ncbi:uncharacterized protein LOC122255318 [Penaeus japonicus]|uniref:uncharacterized protein LOC122255318 n=1 Tax=Penaeus japonicus TaxID=27405 RepID=UPI001C713728|nr:uncharacterized protein LOC122255318 [Penaeus japonicus]
MKFSWQSSLPLTVITLMATLSAWAAVGANGCNAQTKEVGVCLHVYLERDFLSLERIVYHRPLDMYRYTPEELRQPLPPLPELPDEDNASPDIPKEDWKEPKDAEARNVVVGRHQHLLQKEGSSWRRVSREAPGDFAVIDAYGEHGWVEGPELADYCGRIGSVIKCFEDVLIECDSGYDFFRYRHLLHSLDRVHTYLCNTPHNRENRFLPFLRLIDCAERARIQQMSCQRPNVTVNVWNQILRLEIGPELCDSLNTQRACLLENEYVQRECGGKEKEELYKNVSTIFLATWCQLPLPPHLLPSSSSQLSPSLVSLLVTLSWLAGVTLSW